MSIRRFHVAGYRSLDALSWEPLPLEVLRDARGADLFRAAYHFANSYRGWSALAEDLDAELDADPDLWRNDARETRWFVQCDPLPELDDGLAYGHELVLAATAPDAPRRFDVVYERVTRFDDFDEHELLERQGSRVSFVLTPKRQMRSTRGTEKPAREVSSLASDMPALGAIPKFLGDARVLPYADLIAGWRFFRPVPVGPDAPVRANHPTVQFEDRLTLDGANLVNVLYNLQDFDGPRRALGDALGAALTGASHLEFPAVDELHHTAAVRFRDGTLAPLAQLSPGMLRMLLLCGMLLAPSPAPWIWIDRPDEGLDPWMVPLVPELCRFAMRQAKVCLVDPSPRLEGLLGALRSP